MSLRKNNIMKIKKRGLFTAVFLSALMLAGCGNQGENEDNSSAESP